MKIAIIGVGNILFLDEGVGVYAAKLLEQNYRFSPEIDIVDGGTLGFKLMDYLSEYEKVLILDTVSIKEMYGTVYDLPRDALMDLGEYRQTVHEIEVLGMIEMCQLMGKMAQVNIIGVIPEDIVSVKIGLSDTLKASMALLIESTIKNLHASGVEVLPNTHQVTLDEVIDFYQNPTHVKLN